MDKIEKIKSFSTAQVSIYSQLAYTYQLYVTPTQHSEIAKRYDDSYGAHGFNAIVYSLITNVIHSCSESLFSRDSRSPSSFNILGLLKDENVSEHLLGEYSSPLKHNWITSSVDISSDMKREIEEQEDRKRRRERSTDFMHRKETFEILLGELSKSDLFEKVRKARNKVISHFEIKADEKGLVLTTIQDYNITWDEVDHLVRQVEKIIFDAYLLVHNASYSLDILWENAQRVANEFWGVKASFLDRHE